MLGSVRSPPMFYTCMPQSMTLCMLNFIAIQHTHTWAGGWVNTDIVILNHSMGAETTRGTFESTVVAMGTVTRERTGGPT